MKRRTKQYASAGAAVAVIAAASVPVLIGGRIAKEGDYPAIVRITSNSGSGCTAAIVGPRALLTAAHCVSDGGWVRFQTKQTGYTGMNTVEEFTANIRSQPCVHHSGYKQNNTKDFALCKLPQLQPPYIHINTDHDYVKVGDTLTLTGYGCIKKGGGGADGYLRIGSAEVIKTPTRDNFDIVTRAGESALCYGDSGGPAFKGQKLVGVNSRGNIQDTSYLSAVHMADQSYMLKWAKDNKVDICGLTSQCDGKEEQPEPEEGPESESLWATFFWWLIDLIFGGK